MNECLVEQMCWKMVIYSWNIQKSFHFGTESAKKNFYRFLFICIESRYFENVKLSLLTLKHGYRLIVLELALTSQTLFLPVIGLAHFFYYIDRHLACYSTLVLIEAVESAWYCNNLETRANQLSARTEGPASKKANEL